MRAIDESGFLVPDAVGEDEVRLIRAVLAGEEYPPLPEIPDYRVETVVDVGANLGAFAAFARRCYPAARIVCFEPSAPNLLCLRENAERLGGVEVIEHGLYDCDATRQLYRGYSIAGMTDSLHPNRLTSSDSTQIRLWDAASLFGERIGLERLSILKLDTEGAELPILERLSSFLDRIDALLFEFHSEEDRRAVDRLVERSHVLFHARADFPHRGTIGYLRAPLALAAGLDAKRIVRP